MRRFTKKQYLVAGVAAAIIAGTAGSAIAYWTTSGSGTGSATTGTSTAVTLHASFADGLTPGASETVTYKADNTGASAQQVGPISAVVSIDTTHATDGCLASDYTVPNSVGNNTIPAGATGAAAGSSTITFADTANNQDACKGATVTLTLTS
jgi:hypothetical protein